MELGEKLEIMNYKMDLLFSTICHMPYYIAAVQSKHPEREWERANRELQKVAKEYRKLLDYEHRNDITRQPD